MRQGKIRWLYDELPGLVAVGVLSEEAGERIRAHYGPATQLSASRIAVVLCSVLGASLIGSGVILLLAHNWDELGRPIRAVLSFLPLIAGQGLVGWTLWRRDGSVAWRESTSTFLALSVGASIALIGQTYNIPGNLGSFLFTWLLLVLPLVYLNRSAMVLVLYLAGTLAWVYEVQNRSGQGIYYWFFVAAVLPAVLELGAKRPGAARSALIQWSYVLCLCAGVGVAMEKSLPGLWIVVYGTMLASFYYLGGLKRFVDTPSRPLVVAGTVGTIGLSLLLTYDYWWQRIGFTYYRGNPSGNLEWAGYQDYALVLAFAIAVAYLAVRAFGQGDRDALIWALSPILASAGYGLANFDVPPGVMTLFFNIYLFVLGVVLFRSGVVSNRMGVANGGMGVLALLFSLRFFDSDLPILLRAVAFIITGVGFLGANLWLARRRAPSIEEAVA